jgi:hypothetical protein
VQRHTNPQLFVKLMPLGKTIALKCSTRQTTHTDPGVSWSVPSIDRNFSGYLIDFTADRSKT